MTIVLFPHNLGTVTQLIDLQASLIAEAAPMTASSCQVGSAQLYRLPLQHSRLGASDTSSFDCTHHAAEVANASKMAAHLHSMQVHAMDRAWQQQQQRSLALKASAPLPTQAHVSTAVALRPRSELKPSQTAVPTISGQNAGGSNFAHCAAQMQEPQDTASNTNVFAGSITGAGKPVMLNSAQPQHTDSGIAARGSSAAPHIMSERQGSAAPSSQSTHMSTETESLVAKLRALSQGSSSRNQGNAAKTSAQQQQRLPFASRSTNLTQVKPALVQPKPTLPYKQSKLTSNHTSAAAANAQPAKGRPGLQRAGTAQCIQLMEPVHSVTEYEPKGSPEQRGHRLKSRAASSSVSSRTQSGFASVAEQIPLNPPAHQQQQHAAAFPKLMMPVAATAAAAAGAADSSDNANAVGQQPCLPSPMRHRLGKPTPLQKGFTPKPSRFRLEAERLSVTPPDKSNGLEKILFTSPVKPAAQDCAPMQTDSSSTLSEALQTSVEEQIPVQQAAGELRLPAVPLGHNASASSNTKMAHAEHSPEMATPAYMPAHVQTPTAGVFADMRFILDPELSSDDSGRYQHISNKRPWLHALHLHT